MADARKAQLRASQIELLRRVSADDVGWASEYRRRGEITSYRLWSAEHEYTTVTPQIKRLLSYGLVRTVSPHHGRFPRGVVELTDTGRIVLKALG